MKKLLPILVLIAAAAVFFVYRGGNVPGVAGLPGAGGGDGESFLGTVEDLLSSGRTLTCTFSSEDEAGETSGTVYVAGERVRGTFEVATNTGEAFTSEMIRDGDYAYIWSSEQTQGTKMKLEEYEGDAMEADVDTPSSDQPFDFDNEAVDYQCRPWVANNSMFTPPSDIEFVDLSMQMQELQDSVMESMQELGLDCSQCDAVPAGAGRDQCLQALGC